MASETPMLLDSTLHYSLRAAAGDCNVTVIRSGDADSPIWCYFRVHRGQWWPESATEPYIDIPYDPTKLTGDSQADLRSLYEQVAMAAYLLSPVGAQ